jgi:hypothetical protein
MAFLAAVPFIVIFPVTFTVPVEIVISESIASSDVVAIVTEVQDKLPLPTVIILSSPPAPVPVPALMVTAPLTIKEFEPLMISVLSSFPPAIVNVAQTEFRLTVTSSLLSIITVSTGLGGPEIVR